MDLAYIPEVLNFGSFRSTQYWDFEQPWNKKQPDYYGNNKTASYQHHRQQNQSSPSSSSTKDNCHLCKENKRRALAAYIRGKTRNNSCSEICEEIEEEADEEKNVESPKNQCLSKNNKTTAKKH